MTSVVIGVLELQGAFAEHTSMLLRCVIPASASLKVVGIRNASDLAQKPLDGLVLPGGESTVQGKLLEDLGMMDTIRRMIVDEDMAVFGTCAGAILLSNYIVDDSNKGRKQARIGGLGVRIARNAYGRQIDSHETRAIFEGHELRVVQIRAPMIVEVIGEDVKVLASVEVKQDDDGNSKRRAVLVEERNKLAATFHPELTKDCRVHQHFLNMVVRRKNEETDVQTKVD